MEAQRPPLSHFIFREEPPMGPTPARADIMNSKFLYDCISLFVTRSDCHAAKGYQFPRGRISARRKIPNFARTDFMAGNIFPQRGRPVHTRPLSFLYLPRKTAIGSQPACAAIMNSELQYELHHFSMTPTDCQAVEFKSVNIRPVFPKSRESMCGN